MKILSRHSLLLVIFIISALLFFSCDDNSTESSGDDQTTDQQIQESTEAVDYSTMYMETVTMPSSALVSATASAALMKNTANSVAGVADTIFTGCPTATYNVLLKQLVLDYGEGCNGAGGVSHSGSIVLTGSFVNGKLSFATTFNQYTANDYYVNGNVSFVAGIDTIQITISDGTIAHGDTSATMDAELKLVINMNGTPGDPFDDVYTISGFGTVTTPNAKTYSFEITTPLEYHAFCEYPVKGVIEMKTELYTSSIDFFPDNGQCDDIVQVTIGGRSQTIALSDL